MRAHTNVEAREGNGADDETPWDADGFRSEVCSELLNMKATTASYEKNRSQMVRALNVLSAQYLTKKKAEQERKAEGTGAPMDDEHVDEGEEASEDEDGLQCRAKHVSNGTAEEGSGSSEDEAGSSKRQKL